MIRKFAAALVISAERWDAPIVRTSHRAAFSYVPKPGMVYVRSRAISSRCNDNFDMFPADEIAQSYKSFVGKPVFVNHHNADHKRMRGLVIDAALHRDVNPDGSPDTWAEVLMEVDGFRYPRLAKALLAGAIDRTSMGCDVKLSTCSVCHNQATNPLEYCVHIPGKKGQRIYGLPDVNGKREAKLVFEICSGLSFFENSLLVEPPADPTALFLGKVEVGPGLEHLVRSASIAAPGPRQITPAQYEALRAAADESAMTRIAKTAAAGDDWAHGVGMDDERRRKAEEVGGKLWEGMHQIFDPGSTEKSRHGDRNMRATNHLLNVGYHPTSIHHNEDGEPYAEIHHPSGWSLRDHGGAYLDLHHRATGDEAHEVINVARHDPEAGTYQRHPLYGPSEAKQDLDAFVHEDAHDYENQSPKIQRWKRMSSLQAEGVGRDKPTSQMNSEEYAAHQEKTTRDNAEGDAWNAKHKVSPRHITNHWNLATDDEKANGENWYRDAHELTKHIAHDTSTPMHTMAGLMSNYSPQTHWSTNIMNAARVARTKEPLGGPGSGVFASSLQKKAAGRLLGGEHYDKVLGGPKTKAFAHLIEHGGDSDQEDPKVVIDRHALSVAAGDRAGDAAYGRAKLGTKGRYDEISQAYHKAAKSISKKEGRPIAAHQVQAVTWLVRQRLNEAHDRALSTTAGSRSATRAQSAIQEWNKYAGEHHPGAMGKEPGTGYSQNAAEDIKHVQQMKNEGLPVQKLASHRDWLSVDSPPLPIVVESRHDAHLTPFTAMQRHLGYGEIKAPPDVDTLRDENCPVCGNDSAFNGRECQVCGYIAPPKAFGDPDVDKAKQLDELKDNIGDELDQADPSRKGAPIGDDIDQENAELEGDDTASPSLACTNCGTEVRPTPPKTMTGNPDQLAQAGPAEGDPCPFCKGKGQLASTGESPDDEEEDDEQNPADPDADNPDAEDAESATAIGDGKLPASKNARAVKGWNDPVNSQKEQSMRQSLQVLADQQNLINHQQRVINQQQRMVAGLLQREVDQNTKIQRLTAGLTVLAQAAGPEILGQVKVAMIRKHADEQNPAQPVMEPAPEPASESTAETKTPEAFADVTAPGMVPGSNNDVAADAVSTAYTPGQDIPSPAINQLVDVTRPVDGTQGPRPINETKTEIDVRVGNPMNPQVAYPVGGPFANAQRTSSANDGQIRTMASIRLARLQLAAGIATGADELTLGELIATSQRSMESINDEIETLGKVSKAAALTQQHVVQPPRGVVPRAVQGVARTMPSMQYTAALSASGANDDSDVEFALLDLG